MLVPLLLDACAKKQERQQRPAAQVVVTPARRATVPYIIEANGIVTPNQTASVVPQVDGIVQSVDFQEGQEVRKGQPLFHIDPRPYQNAYNQAVAILSRDSANYLAAKANGDRTRQLLSSKVITQQEGEATLATAATTEATLRADHANVDQAKFNLDNTIIRAPIDGKTGGLLVRQGNLVRSGGAAPLVVINQVRPILVRFAIPSSDLPLVLQYGSNGGLPVTAVPGGIAPPTPSIDSLAAEAMAQPSDNQGQSASGSPNGGSRGGRRGGQNGQSGAGAPGASSAGGSFGGPNADAGANANGRGRRNGGANGGQHDSTARGGQGRRGQGKAGQGANGSAVQQGTIVSETMTGKLSFIDNAVDTATGTVQLKAVFDNANGRLWTGQFATTSLHLFDEQNALVVPQQAVVTGQRGSYVYVVDQADTARQRAVTIERTADGLAVIANGIHEGDRVVIEGHLRLTPDSPVRIRGANDNSDAGQGRRGGRRGGGAGKNGAADKGGSGGAGRPNGGGGGS